MSQLVLIDEEELKELKFKAAWADNYRKAFAKSEFQLYPNYIIDSPVCCGQYDLIILEKLVEEVKRNRKKKRLWRNKI